MSNLNDARYEFLGELYGIKNGTNVDRVDFYASYISVESNDIEEPTKPIATYSYLDFTIQESGLPGTTFSIYLSDILHSLNIELNSIEYYGSIKIRWEVVLKDGSVFTDKDASSIVKNHFIYNSPYFAIVPFVGSIPLKLFTGVYEITQESPGSNIYDSSILFSDDYYNDTGVFTVPSNTIPLTSHLDE